MTTKQQPTTEQLAALIQFAAENGRNWKSTLRACWMIGNYQTGTYYTTADTAALQQVRNEFGPSWLVRFSLAKAEAAQATAAPAPAVRIVDTVSICDDCVADAASGDYSAFRLEGAIDPRQRLDGTHRTLAVGIEQGFDWAPCELCGSDLAGNRHEASILEQEVTR
jgi:hypothetical protein